MRNFYQGTNLQDIVDNVTAQQLDSYVVEVNYEHDYDGFRSEMYLNLRVALFPKPAVSAESVKGGELGDFDAAMEIIK